MLKLIKLLILTTSILITPQAYATDVKAVTFSGGAPLHEYQPRIIVPVLTEAFKRNGIAFNAVYYPSLRSLMYSNSGRTDGELHRVYDFHSVSQGQYPNLVRIDTLLLSVWLAAFTNKKIRIEDWDDLKGYRVVYYLGRKNVENYLSRVLPPERIKHTTTDDGAFKMVADGLADIVISESRQGNQIIAKNIRYHGIKEVGRLGETKIYSYIHHKYKDIAPQISATLKKMKRDGSFKTIVDQANRMHR